METENTSAMDNINNNKTEKERKKERMNEEEKGNVAPKKIKNNKNCPK